MTPRLRPPSLPSFEGVPLPADGRDSRIGTSDREIETQIDTPDCSTGRNTVEIRVRYAETDRMGRAHHSHLLVWCEKGRTAWLRERGATYAELEKDGIYLPVSRVHAEYRAGAAYDERVAIETRVQDVRSRTVTFGYRLFRVGDDARLARATTQLVCVDAEGATRRLPEDLRQLLLSAEERARSVSRSD